MKKKDRALFKKLFDKNNIMIIIHKNPDGDTLGSGFALCHALQKLDKRACVVCSDIIKKRMLFISDGIAELKPEFEPEFIISVDTATKELIGESLQKYADKVDCSIDHHYTNTLYAKDNIINDASSSVGELLYDLMKSCNMEIDYYIAEKLYCAISFDTGCFKFSNVTSHTFYVASNLMKFKIPASVINMKLFDIASLEQLKIENAAVSSVKQYKNNCITMVTVTQKMLMDLGVQDVDIEGLTAITRRVEGTVVGITLREMSDGIIKVSLRSTDKFNVSNVAILFGGGGHVKASGCVLSGPVEEAEKRILKAVFEEWDKTYDNINR
ncbi:MAG: phosphoesterase RecJ protein [Clostridia bacterium]|nr:phosphoesterase RecJ protein [Clostridia bacterium]